MEAAEFPARLGLQFRLRVFGCQSSNGALSFSGPRPPLLTRGVPTFPGWQEKRSQGPRRREAAPEAERGPALAWPAWPGLLAGRQVGHRAGRAPGTGPAGLSRVQARAGRQLSAPRRSERVAAGRASTRRTPGHGAARGERHGAQGEQRRYGWGERARPLPPSPRLSAAHLFLPTGSKQSRLGAQAAAAAGRGPATTAGLEVPHLHRPPRRGAAHQIPGLSGVSREMCRRGVPGGPGDTWALRVRGELWGARRGPLGICGGAIRGYGGHQGGLGYLEGEPGRRPCSVGTCGGIGVPLDIVGGSLESGVTRGPSETSREIDPQGV